MPRLEFLIILRTWIVEQHGRSRNTVRAIKTPPLQGGWRRWNVSRKPNVWFKLACGADEIQVPGHPEDGERYSVTCWPAYPRACAWVRVDADGWPALCCLRERAFGAMMLWAGLQHAATSLPGLGGGLEGTGWFPREGPTAREPFCSAGRTGYFADGACSVRRGRLANMGASGMGLGATAACHGAPSATKIAGCLAGWRLKWCFGLGSLLVVWPLRVGSGLAWGGLYHGLAGSWPLATVGGLSHPLETRPLTLHSH